MTNLYIAKVGNFYISNPAPGEVGLTKNINKAGIFSSEGAAKTTCEMEFPEEPFKIIKIGLPQQT